MYLFGTLDPHPPTAAPILGQSPKNNVFFLTEWLFSLNFGTLDPHLPIEFLFNSIGISDFRPLSAF